MAADRMRPRARLACIALSVALIAGCATGANPRDPLEPFNRGVYRFNDTLDKAIMKPVAQAYRAVLPQFVRSSVSNFFSNVNDVVVALNNLLQGKFTAAYSDLGRIAINSTLGVLGLFDVATEAGIEKHEEDFGQTLARWGMGDGPFVMLPFFGPSTGRDTVGRVVDLLSDPMTYVEPTRARNQIWAVRVVNRRAELLDASTVLQTAALDPYEFVRDAYLQRRRNLIYDGAPPPDREFIDGPPKSRSSAPQSAPARIAQTAPARRVEAAPLRPAAATKATAVKALPAKIERIAASESPFPWGSESAGTGSILVSGEAHLPVQSRYSEPAPAVAAAAPSDTPRLPSLAQLWRAIVNP